MGNIERCPLSTEDKKKYCMCETCLFVKKCLEDMNEKTQENPENGTVTKKCRYRDEKR